MSQPSHARYPHLYPAFVPSSSRSPRSLLRTEDYPAEHLHSHPRYGGLHLVTWEEAEALRPAPEATPGRVRRFLSAFWESDPRRARQNGRRTMPAA